MSGGGAWLLPPPLLVCMFSPINEKPANIIIIKHELLMYVYNMSCAIGNWLLHDYVSDDDGKDERRPAVPPLSG